MGAYEKVKMPSIIIEDATTGEELEFIVLENSCFFRIGNNVVQTTDAVIKEKLEELKKKVNEYNELTKKKRKKKPTTNENKPKKTKTSK